MNTLRSLRQRRKLTQQDLADLCQTTQQTVARWETGKTEIPSNQLAHLATFFECPVDELLGAPRQERRRVPRGRGQRRAKSAPFGTLTAVFGFGERDYPIDQEQRHKLRRRFMNHACFDASHELIAFSALDNRLVFLNPAHLHDLKITSDETDGMPYFASSEAYRALTHAAPDEALTPEIADECVTIAARLGVAHALRQEADAKHGERVIAASRDVRTALSTTTLVRPNGKSESVFLSDKGAIAIMALENATHEIGAKSLIVIDEEDSDFRVINLQSVSAIEVPLEAYLSALEEDSKGNPAAD